jgi:hypothetical protein
MDVCCSFFLKLDPILGSLFVYWKLINGRLSDSGSVIPLKGLQLDSQTKATKLLLPSDVSRSTLSARLDDLSNNEACSLGSRGIEMVFNFTSSMGSSRLTAQQQ